MKYSWEQISDKLSAYIYMGFMLLITLCIGSAIWIALKKLKRKYLLTIVLTALSIVLCIIIPHVNVREYVIYGMVTAEITCMAVLFIVAEIVMTIQTLVRAFKEKKQKM